MKYLLTLALTVAFATSTFAGKCCSGDECDDKGKDKDKTEEPTKS